MNMRISLKVSNPQYPVRYLDNIPVYPMGHNLSLIAEFTNIGSGELSIEDPKTSQKLLLWLYQEGINQKIVTEVNPGSIDITGEITAHPTSIIQLQSKESTSVSIELFKYLMEKCFLPGKYEVYIEFMEVSSPRLRYGVEYGPESVPKLIELALDDTVDSWIREQSVLWLQKLPKPPGIELEKENETQAEISARKIKNQEKARIFLENWPKEKETKAVIDFFEDNRMKG
jgi:hypothetical protein